MTRSPPLIQNVPCVNTPLKFARPVTMMPTSPPLTVTVLFFPMTNDE